MSAALMAALSEAVALGHRHAGLPHVVLALLDERRPSVARDALLAAGVTPEFVATFGVETYGSVSHDPQDQAGAVAEPLWHETAGRAQGFAAGIGERVVRPEHVLLALLWQPRPTWFEGLLRAAGTSREALVDDLASRGVTVPEVPLPPLPPRMTQAARFPRAHLQEVTRALRVRAPQLHWGIGSDRDDDTRMVVLAASDVDLVAVLDEVVGTGAWSWDPRSGRLAS